MRPGFVPEKATGNRILLLRPEITVNEIAAGGLDQPKADWNDSARAALIKSMSAAMTARGQMLTEMPELKGDDAKLLANYRALLKVIGEAAVGNNLFPSDPLPLHKGGLKWTVGPGISALAKAAGGGDYALVFGTSDSFSSSSRGAAEAVAELMDQPVPKTNRQGNAALIDLKTGDLVWMMIDGKMSGDVRTPEGAAKRTTELLRQFPFPLLVAEPAAPAPAQAKAKSK